MLEKVTAKSNKYILLAPIFTTIILAGPVGWFFIDLSDKNYSRMPFLFVISLIVTVVAVIQWMMFFLNRAVSKEMDE
jgi:hypothetical protein